MNLKWALLPVAALLLTGCTKASSFFKPGYDFSQLNKVAVAEVTGARGDTGAQNEVADLFSMEMLKRGFSVVERKQVETILKEQQLQQGGMTSREDPVKMGEVLNVQAVMIINIPIAGQKVDLTAKLVEVKTGDLLWMGEGTGNTKSGVATIGGALVGAAAGAVVGNQVSHGRGAGVGAVGGGLAGGVVGYMLEPSEAETLRKVVKKVCNGLPARMAQSN
jgi:hypothetical protein